MYVLTRPILTLCKEPVGVGVIDLTSSRMVESSSMWMGSSSRKLFRCSSRICCGGCDSIGGFEVIVGGVSILDFDSYCLLSD